MSNWCRHDGTRELADGAAAEQTVPLPVEIAPRRAGDAPVLVGDNTKAREQLGWQPSRHLDDTLSSAWRWAPSFQALAGRVIDGWGRRDAGSTEYSRKSLRCA
ncbi:GDP-mannose 4,6-dehydratase [Caulobacter segnis]